MEKSRQNEELLVNLKFEKLDQMVKEYNSFDKDVSFAGHHHKDCGKRI